MRVGIALGSNLGDRVAQMEFAIAAIRARSQSPIFVSRLHETAPVDCPAGSPPFLNAAMEIGYHGDLLQLLEYLRSLETAAGRLQVSPRNAPRPLDLDLLYADGVELSVPNLTIPHPELMHRLFVLIPLCEIAPHRRLPGCLETFEERKDAMLRDAIIVKASP